jgi:hypothetical protein
MGKKQGYNEQADPHRVEATEIRQTADETGASLQLVSKCYKEIVLGNKPLRDDKEYRLELLKRAVYKEMANPEALVFDIYSPQTGLKMAVSGFKKTDSPRKTGEYIRGLVDALEGTMPEKGHDPFESSYFDGLTQEQISKLPRSKLVQMATEGIREKAKRQIREDAQGQRRE